MLLATTCSSAYTTRRLNKSAFDSRESDRFNFCRNALIGKAVGRTDFGDKLHLCVLTAGRAATHI